jgi:uncharacterized BrkB/YihY/UPF0761 family membrane protein
VTTLPPPNGLPAPEPLPPPAAQAGSVAPTEPPSRLAKLKVTVATARAKGDEIVEQLEAARPRHRSIDVAFVSVHRDTAAGGPVLAAAIAFRIFLFLVPYVFVIVYGFGLASSATGADPQTVAKKAGITGLMASTIQVADEQPLFTRIVVFITALYALFSTARTFLKVLVIVHALAWQRPPHRIRKVTKPALIFIAIVSGTVVLIQLILWLRDKSFIAGLTAEILFIAVPATVWLVLSMRFFVHAPEAGWRDLLPGAVLVGVGVQVLHFVTVYWITHLFASKSETYGAIGAALAILFWAYLLGRILAASAIVNAAAWQQKHPVPLPPPPPSAGS